jgi:hypothetical protein
MNLGKNRVIPIPNQIAVYLIWIGMRRRDAAPQRVTSVSASANGKIQSSKVNTAASIAFKREVAEFHGASRTV